MKAARLINKHEFEIVEIDIPTINSDEVLIKTKACGLCSSELPVWHGEMAKYPFDPGFPGHEAMGEIVKVGDNVKDLKIGDFVTTISFPGKSYAEYFKAKACFSKKINRIDENFIGEPVACVSNALDKIEIKETDNILLIGCGFMGLLFIKLLNNYKFNKLIAISKKESSRERAKIEGATDIIMPSNNNKVQIKKLTNGTGVDIVIEAAGTQDSLDLAIDSVRNEGQVMIFGFHSGMRNLHMSKWNFKAVDIINAHVRSDKKYFSGLKKSVERYEKNEYNFDLITHKFKLADINKAFNLLNKKPEKYIKGVIYFE
jgi:threonine dehydrogenase-like Zn-dependent dehydrogenase